MIRMNTLITAIIVGLLAVAGAWVDNKVIRPSDEELSQNTIWRYFAIGSVAGFIISSVSGYGLFSFFPGADADLGVPEPDVAADSIKIGRPTF
jgi:hypothetical protein